MLIFIHFYTKLKKREWKMKAKTLFSTSVWKKCTLPIVKSQCPTVIAEVYRLLCGTAFKCCESTDPLYQTTHHGKYTRLFFVGGDIWSRKRGNAVKKKQHYLFLSIMCQRCVWNHMIPLFLALWPHVWSHAFLQLSVLHHTLKPAWMGSRHNETLDLFSLSSFLIKMCI